jgi:Transglycosylase SLT domain
MRAILAFTILLLGLTGAAPEPKYSLRGDDLRASRDLLDGLIKIESSSRRGDRLSLAALGPRVLRVEVLRPEERKAPLRLASLNSEFGAVSDGGDDRSGVDAQADAPTAPPQPTALDNLCNTLFTSAQDNDLPVPFFANLLWQESRLRVDDVSKKGAQGIAQFMPKTAAETGLANPFDPMQAIPASARFLQRLRLQFGNLGFVAAAYNAGAHRVIEWLERRASLPRETRDYVVRVTGLSVEAWKTMPIENAALTFVPHLPCRSLPAFANVEQEQMQQSELERAKRALAADAETPNPGATYQAVMPAAPEQPHQSKHERAHEAHHLARETSKPASKREAKHELLRIARAGRGATHEAKHDTTRVAREGHASKHEAAHTPRGGRERHRSA